MGCNIGSEQNKKRPIIVLNDTNFTRPSMVIVAPITSNGKKIYDPEVKILETAYNNVTGKIDLSQMRSVSMCRLDSKPIDRLLSYEEYKKKFGNEEFTMLQAVIQNKIKNIFGIAV